MVRLRASDFERHVTAFAEEHGLARSQPEQPPSQPELGAAVDSRFGKAAHGVLQVGAGGERFEFVQAPLALLVVDGRRLSGSTRLRSISSQPW